MIPSRPFAPVGARPSPLDAMPEPPRHTPSRDETLGDQSAHPAPLSTGLQVVLLMMVLVLILLMAGVPGLEPVAGNGTRKLRQGWAERRAAAVTAPAPAAPAAATLPGDADGSVDRNDANR